MPDTSTIGTAFGTAAVRRAIVALRACAFTAIPVAFACSPPQAPSREAALVAVRAVLTAESMARITATACQRYAAQYTADSIRIGEYNRDAKAWPVRAFIGGECMAPGSRRFTGIQSDYMVIADGFGGWKVAQKGDFVVATPQLAPLPSLDGVWQVGSANLYFQLLDYDSAEGYLVSLGRRGADSAISWQQTNNLQPVAFFHGAKLRGQIGEGFYELELIGQNGLRLSEHQEYGVEATALHRVGIGRAEGTATPAK